MQQNVYIQKHELKMQQKHSTVHNDQFMNSAARNYVKRTAVYYKVISVNVLTITGAMAMEYILCLKAW